MSSGIGNQNKIQIGDREFWLGEQLLGYTKGGVTFEFKREFEDITVDQFGSAPLDMILKGQDLTITAMLAEPSTFNLSKAIPEGDYEAAGVDDKLGLGRQAGFKLSDRAATLRLHKRDRAATDYTDDIFIWKAVSFDAVKLDYKIDGMTILESKFRALVDTSRTDGNLLGRIGPDLIS